MGNAQGIVRTDDGRHKAHVQQADKGYHHQDQRQRAKGAVALGQQVQVLLEVILHKIRQQPGFL